MPKGILVDRAGFYVGAFQWADGQAFKVPAGLVLLIEPGDLEIDNPRQRFDFDSRKWIYPTLKRWVVRQRRDIPRLWFLSGSINIFQERPPVYPEGIKLIDKKPPPTGAIKAAWDDQAGSWVTPKRVALLNEENIITGFVASYLPDDRPKAARAIEFPLRDLVPDAADDEPTSIEVTVEAEDEETGEMLPLDIGDELTFDGTNWRGKIKRTIARKRFPVRFLRDALQDAGQLANFVAFLEARGFTAADFDALDVVSLNTKILRDFIADQGFTVKQAYQAIVSAAETAASDDQGKRAALGEEAVSEALAAAPTVPEEPAP